MHEIGKKINKKLTEWAAGKYYQLALFNVILIFLFLLHSVGYFYPFFPVTINVIVLAMFVLAILLLGVHASAFFTTAIFFWLITLVFKMVRIDVWAERTGVYVYESLVVGIILLFLENLDFKFGNKS